MSSEAEWQISWRMYEMGVVLGSRGRAPDRACWLRLADCNAANERAGRMIQCARGREWGKQLLPSSSEDGYQITDSTSSSSDMRRRH